MRLQQLKQQVYEDWERRCWYNGAVIQPELFKLEVRTFGDLRCRSTWVRALCRFHALNVWEGCMDSWTLITLHFNFQSGCWNYEFRQQILDEFLTIPGAFDALKVGFEQLFDSDIKFTTQEKEAGYGLLAMVGQQSGRTGGTTALTGSERP
ncbi:hypothetical protein H6F67_25660 [Microcoleus sp. FACHB-1515]|uniref:hypothetical protein n=1 Tax=Cyanophyceae TaxID=3028117 RepID=UPI00168411B4|nr:hypothetical protein [Microcoleus sp. FACHB-1515]MBD2093235.1 hypothetical protein [Microcoleus sp. FACHB-1515]